MGCRIGAARSLARKLIKDSKIVEIPVSLRQVVEYLQIGKDIVVVPYNFGEKISGMLVRVDESSTIGYNDSQHWHRRRFTIAHEIGHLLFNHDCERDPGDDAEREAHEFAAELLMPASFLREDFKEEQNLDKLAEKYIVSKEALCRHLINLRII